jgi:hypothetical protein
MAMRITHLIYTAFALAFSSPLVLASWPSLSGAVHEFTDAGGKSANLLATLRAKQNARICVDSPGISKFEITHDDVAGVFKVDIAVDYVEFKDWADSLYHDKSLPRWKTAPAGGKMRSHSVIKDLVSIYATADLHSLKVERNCVERVSADGKETLAIWNYLSIVIKDINPDTVLKIIQAYLLSFESDAGMDVYTGPDS